MRLGLNTDTADCYLTRFGIDEDWEIKVLNNIKYSEVTIGNQDYCIPCWSVGRMIEILLKKLGNRVFCYENTEMPLTEAFVQRLEYWMEKGYDFKNFELC